MDDQSSFSVSSQDQSLETVSKKLKNGQKINSAVKQIIIKQSAVADLEGVPWVPWNTSFERLPLFLLRKHNYIHGQAHLR